MLWPQHLLETRFAPSRRSWVPYAEAPSQVRGVVTGLNNESITVTRRNGSMFTLRTDTAYAYVVPASLDAIKVNGFVGTVVKAP